MATKESETMLDRPEDWYLKRKVAEELGWYRGHDCWTAIGALAEHVNRPLEDVARVVTGLSDQLDSTEVRFMDGDQTIRATVYKLKKEL